MQTQPPALTGAGIMSLKADLKHLSSRELLDQYAALAMLPDEMSHLTIARLAVIRDILLDRLTDQST